MSPETYEQITVADHLFGSAAAFLMPDMAVTINSTEDGQHLSGELGISSFYFLSSPCACKVRSSESGPARAPGSAHLVGQGCKTSWCRR